MRSAAWAAIALAALLAACGGNDEPGPDGASVQTDTDAVEASGPDDEQDAGLSQQQVTLYFPSIVRDGLVPETSEIFYTASAVDRAKQVIADLVNGPNSDGALPCLPASARLRQVYLMDDGTAWADFTGSLQADLLGGSSVELLAVYSIINSLAYNIEEIRRVGILIDGRQIRSLTGHVDLSRPLPPSSSWILDPDDLEDLDDDTRPGGRVVRLLSPP